MLATWPAVRDARTSFLAGGAPGYGEAAPGDHLQTGYRFWLVGHQLGQGGAPWRDPYSFRPESAPRPNLGGWPFGLPYWPLHALFGTVVAWNLFVLLSYLGAGGLACTWLRALGLARGPALVGGLAFALAPYRVEQSTGHLLGPISMLLPLSLWALERRRPVVAAAALASIPLSGQVHLALGAIPFVLAYAAARGRIRQALPAAALAVAAGLLVDHAVIAGSLQAGGRSLREVTRYSAEWSDLVSRHKGETAETFVFLGWATPLLALAGLTAVGRRGLAVVLAAGAAAPVLLSLGTNLPLYAWLWRHVPGFGFPRVPERLMPIACLCLAALVAYALQDRRRLAPLALVLVALDLHVPLYGASAADEGNRAYAALRGAPPGRLLELPVYLPDVHLGSVYLYYDMQAPRQRPLGYSTLATATDDATARRLRDQLSPELLRRLGVRYVAVHRGGRLRLPGYRVLARDGPITMYERGLNSPDDHDSIAGWKPLRAPRQSAARQRP